MDCRKKPAIIEKIYCLECALKRDESGVSKHASREELAPIIRIGRATLSPPPVKSLDETAAAAAAAGMSYGRYVALRIEKQ